MGDKRVDGMVPADVGLRVHEDHDEGRGSRSPSLITHLVEGDHVVFFGLLPPRFRLFRRDLVLAAAARGLVAHTTLCGPHVARVLAATEHLLLRGMAARARRRARERVGSVVGVPASSTVFADRVCRGNSVFCSR